MIKKIIISGLWLGVMLTATPPSLQASAVKIRYNHSVRYSTGKAWKRHIIDDSSRGADGVRLADVNKDGLMDIATGWEEGGITRIYMHPGRANAREKWPAVTVGKTPSVEDAVFVDLDKDGEMDVVSSCEGSTKTIFVQWAPKDKERYLKPEAWRQTALMASRNLTQWMFCLPMQVDDEDGVDLIAGAKGKNAQIGWFKSPANARNVADYHWQCLSPAGWIMSLIKADMDGDGDLDIVTSDRKGKLRGCRWLENPGPAQPAPWKNHFIGARDEEVMFMTIADLDKDNLQDVLVAVKGKTLQKIIYFRRLSVNGKSWKQQVIPLPDNAGTTKAVAVGDIDNDGYQDIVFSCENAYGNKSAVFWLSRLTKDQWAQWLGHDISGPGGIKFDRLELLDIDGDGDLDVLTCEESTKDLNGKSKGLGVIWYENPYSQ